MNQFLSSISSFKPYIRNNGQILLWRIILITFFLMQVVFALTGNSKHNDFYWAHLLLIFFLCSCCSAYLDYFSHGHFGLSRSYSLYKGMVLKEGLILGAVLGSCFFILVPLIGQLICFEKFSYFFLLFSLYMAVENLANFIQLRNAPHEVHNLGYYSARFGVFCGFMLCEIFRYYFEWFDFITSLARAKLWPFI